MINSLIKYKISSPFSKFLLIAFYVNYVSISVFAAQSSAYADHVVTRMANKIQRTILS